MFIVKESKGVQSFIIKIEKTIEVKVQIFQVFEISTDAFTVFVHSFACEFIAPRKDEEI